MFQFIQQQEDLEPILGQMGQCSTYGLDTEFIKVDTLWPKLGVFQINVNHQVYLLDGTTLDLSAFWHKIFAAQQNIFHACGEDIDLIYHYAGQKNLNNVFDTQVALSFLGYGLQVSYQNALKILLNIDIDKDQTRSDWLARPLTQEQLNYAANDVLYIMQLSQKIQSELQAKGMLDWVLEDCRHLTFEIGQDTPTEKLYQDVGNYRHSRRELMQLQRLAVWREELAKALNIPKSFILKNSSLMDMVERNPRNPFLLAAVKDIRPNIVREYGKTILALLKDLPEPHLWPERLPRPLRASQQLSEKIDTILASAVEQTGIPKEVLMRKKWMNALHQHVLAQSSETQLPQYLLGWRYDLITRPLIAVLQQDFAAQLGDSA